MAISRGYVTTGTLGALVGASIFAFFFGQFTDTLGYLKLNHVGEALGVVFVCGLVWDLLPQRVRFTPLLLAPVAFVVGLLWEPLSFLSAFHFGRLLEITLDWFVYGGPVIFLVGTPVLIISRYVKKEQKLFGIKSVGNTGLFINFVICMVLTIVMLWLMFNYGAFATMENFIWGVK